MYLQLGGAHRGCGSSRQAPELWERLQEEVTFLKVSPEKRTNGDAPVGPEKGRLAKQEAQVQFVFNLMSSGTEVRNDHESNPLCRSHDYAHNEEAKAQKCEMTCPESDS